MRIILFVGVWRFRDKVDINLIYRHEMTAMKLEDN